MFTSSHHGNPAFHIGQEEAAKPKPPEKPVIPYLRYSRKIWETVKASNPLSKMWEIGKIVGSLWRELPDSGKQIFNEEYEIEKAQYHEALRVYQNSPAYQHWMSVKARSSLYDHGGGDHEANARMLNEHGASSNRISIQTDDDMDPEAQFSAKHVAATRFCRNAAAMATVLSRTMPPPDPSEEDGEQRIDALQHHVEQLNSNLYQQFFMIKERLNDEVAEMEKRHAKCKRFHQDAIQFDHRYKKLCEETAVRVTEEQFAQMVKRCRTDLEQRQIALATASGASSSSTQGTASSTSSAPASQAPQNQGPQETNEPAAAPPSQPEEVQPRSSEEDVKVTDADDRIPSTLKDEAITPPQSSEENPGEEVAPAAAAVSSPSDPVIKTEATEED